MIGYQRTNEGILTTFPQGSTKMTDPPKGKAQEEALHQEQNSRTHQHTETPISGARI
jgi:hypothetical protein